MIKLHPKHVRHIGKILMFGFVWLVFAILYTLIEKGILGESNIYPGTGNAYDFEGSFFLIIFSSCLMGCTMGSAEVFFLNKIFDTKPFGQKLLFKSSLYFVVICLFILFVALLLNSTRLNVSPFSEEVIQIVKRFFFNLAFWSVAAYIAMIIGISLFIAEISDNLGQGVLVNFLIGRYHTPLVEDRIFMFLDMKSSTTIAERMGHIKYYQLLNEYYADLTKAILDTAGEIYQYVGDEVVVSWQVKTGLENSNCLACFFQAKEIFKENSESYLEKYEVVPEFKAGFHMGSITTGEIGVIKKEIIFTGDVLNTTARIQGKCNEYKVDILLSEALKDQLPADGYKYEEIGSAELRGKNEVVVLHTASKD